MKRLSHLCSLAPVLFLFPALPSIAADTAYHLIKEIPVSGEGGWDYLSVDSDARRLYVSHATKIMVIETANDRVIGEIEDTPGVHGFAVAHDLGRGFSSNGRENKVSIVDLNTLKTLSKVETAENPDAILYFATTHEVYAFNGRGHSATVIDAKSGNVVSTIPLPGKPEFAVEDPKAGMIYNNIEDKNEVVAIDAKSHKIVNTWPIEPGEGASGMAIDTANHRLFLGCDNEMMLMLDSGTGKVLDKVAIGKGVDANAFDPGAKLAFASCGDGTTTIARENGNTLSLAQTLKTARGARTMTIDTKTHRIYLAAAEFEPAPEKKEGKQRSRPKMVPGTFKILVYGM
jgi:DNA-binding beta-propeller fold protein YncE